MVSCHYVSFTLILSIIQGLKHQLEGSEAAIKSLIEKLRQIEELVKHYTCN